MSDAPDPSRIWVLLREHGLLPEMGDRSIRGGSPAVSFDAIVERVRRCPTFPMTPEQVDEALHHLLWNEPPEAPGRIFL